MVLERNAIFSRPLGAGGPEFGQRRTLQETKLVLSRIESVSSVSETNF